jgi:hypothetical protein
LLDIVNHNPNVVPPDTGLMVIVWSTCLNTIRSNSI